LQTTPVAYRCVGRIWPTCNTSLTTCDGALTTCIADLAAAKRLPATGQTTSSTAGDDGAIRAGVALSYTDGDGTITDNNTGLMWEKKSDDGTIHDKDTTHTWDNAFAVHIAGLNTVPCFAGYCDWRLPNVKELQSIIDYENNLPAVDPAFNTGCAPACTVTICSCTRGSPHWSSTSYDFNPISAWSVGFHDGNVLADLKGNGDSVVRAVRGGL